MAGYTFLLFHFINIFIFRENEGERKREIEKKRKSNVPDSERERERDSMRAMNGGRHRFLPWFLIEVSELK